MKKFLTGMVLWLLGITAVFAATTVLVPNIPFFGSTITSLNTATYYVPVQSGTTQANISVANLSTAIAGNFVTIPNSGAYYNANPAGYLTGILDSALTAKYIPYRNGATGFANSPIYTTGGAVSIGYTTYNASYMLNVNGGIYNAGNIVSAGSIYAQNNGTMGFGRASINEISNGALVFKYSTGASNGIEGMRINTGGSLLVGTSVFTSANPEKLLVEAGTTSSVNAIVGRGSINNYFQLNIQNRSTGTNASSDIVATADNGSESTNFIDMGINSSTYTGSVPGVANDAYLYSQANNLYLGTTNPKAIYFMTSGSIVGTISGMNFGMNTTGPVAQMEMHATTASLPATTSTTPGVGTLVRFSSNSSAVLDMGTAGSIGGWIQSYLGTNLATNYPMLINPNGGNVGIGQTGANYALDVSGVTNTKSLILSVNNTALACTLTGQIIYSGGSFFGCASSTWKKLDN